MCLKIRVKTLMTKDFVVTFTAVHSFSPLKDDVQEVEKKKKKKKILCIYNT